MFMISLTILFHSGMSRFTDEHVKKLRLLLKFSMRIIGQTFACILYCRSIVDIQTRQLVGINAILNPDRHWIKQALRGN